MKGFQLRYIYFLDPKWRERLSVPIIPFKDIDKYGAGLYKGEQITREERHEIKSHAQIEKQREEIAENLKSE